MNKHTRLITALLIIVISISAISFASFSANATEGVDGEEGDQPVATEYVPEYTDPPVDPEPVEPVTDAPSYVEPVTDAPSYVEPVTDAPSYVDNSDYYSDPDDDYISQSSEYSYIGGGQSYVAPESTAPSAALYDTKNDVDDKTLSNSDWKEIAGNLANADAGDGSDDFNFIKKNNSANDNGEWLLICGIICLVLSAAGIGYVVVSAVLRKKNTKNGGSSSSKKPAYAGAADGGKARYRSEGDYGDGYSYSSKSSKRRSKFDTAEVKIPKSSQSNRYKNSNGKRYK